MMQNRLRTVFDLAKYVRVCPELLASGIFPKVWAQVCPQQRRVPQVTTVAIMVFTCIAEKNGTTPQQEPGRQGGVGWGLSSQLQHVHRLEILISVSKQFENDSLSFKNQWYLNTLIWKCQKLEGFVNVSNPLICFCIRWFKNQSADLFFESADLSSWISQPTPNT